MHRVSKLGARCHGCTGRCGNRAPRRPGCCLHLCHSPGRAFWSFYTTKRHETHSMPEIKLRPKLACATFLIQAPAHRPPGARWWVFPGIFLKSSMHPGDGYHTALPAPSPQPGFSVSKPGLRHQVSHTCSSHLAGNSFQIRGFYSVCRAVGIGQELRGITLSRVLLHLASFESIQAAD